VKDAGKTPLPEKGKRKKGHRRYPGRSRRRRRPAPRRMAFRASAPFRAGRPLRTIGPDPGRAFRWPSREERRCATGTGCSACC
jgi:hypothetical protein